MKERAFPLGIQEDRWYLVEISLHNEFKLTVLTVSCPKVCGGWWFKPIAVLRLVQAEQLTINTRPLCCDQAGVFSNCYLISCSCTTTAQIFFGMLGLVWPVGGPTHFIVTLNSS